MGYLRSIVDSFTVLENEIVWKNISLDRHPEENAVVCGFLTNSESGKPINDSQVFVEWGHHFEGYQNSTKTDESGFYKFSIASGEIGISFEHHNFIPKVTDEIEIEEGQKLWINDSLKPRPEENAILNGYVFDSTSDNRIANAQIYIEWKDTDGNQLTYRTSTNESGFFVIQLAPGESYITVSAADFEEKSLGRNDAIKDKTEWVNISLEPERIQLDITKPLNAIYLNDERIIPFPQCILIGTIEVEASVHDDWFRSMDDEVAKVEFYIDGELKETMESSPFTWNWNEKTVGRHSLKIIAYDKKGFSVQDDREVLLI
jgi:hypothetical protein